MFMKEPKGKISIVMPTGKRMESINNLSEAIKANSQATVSLARVIDELKPAQVEINGCHIHSGGQSPGINISTEETSVEQGVYHYSPTGYTAHDYGYPKSRKLCADEEIPKCYGEDEEPYDEAYEEGVRTFEEDEEFDESDSEEEENLFNDAKEWFQDITESDPDLLIEKRVITKERVIEMYQAEND